MVLWEITENKSRRLCLHLLRNLLNQLLDLVIRHSRNPQQLIIIRGPASRALRLRKRPPNHGPNHLNRDIPNLELCNRPLQRLCGILTLHAPALLAQSLLRQLAHLPLALHDTAHVARPVLGLVRAQQSIRHGAAYRGQTRPGSNTRPGIQQIDALGGNVDVHEPRPQTQLQEGPRRDAGVGYPARGAHLAEVVVDLCLTGEHGQRAAVCGGGVDAELGGDEAVDASGDGCVDEADGDAGVRGGGGIDEGVLAV